MTTVVLYQPQIPQNTGNVVRTCAVTGTTLILIPPFGFSINDRWLKRAGLDYWNDVFIKEVSSLDEAINSAKGAVYFFTSKGKQAIDTVSYDKDAMLVFGSETSGLPDETLSRFPDQCVRIPMLAEARCLNLATSVGIGVYEAQRQSRVFRE